MSDIERDERGFEFRPSTWAADHQMRPGQTTAPLAPENCDPDTWYEITHYMQRVVAKRDNEDPKYPWRISMSHRCSDRVVKDPVPLVPGPMPGQYVIPDTYLGAEGDLPPGVRADRERADRRIAEVERERDAAVARADASEKRHKWPKMTPAGHAYIAPRTYAELCHLHGDAAQAAVESWEADECPPEPTWEMVGIAHREVERLQRECDEMRPSYDESVSFAYWAAKRLGCHVDDLDGLTLTEMTERVAAQPAPAVSRAEPSLDAEDCDACAEVQDRCHFHRGVAEGIGMVAQKLGVIAADPDLLALIPDRRREAEAVVDPAEAEMAMAWAEYRKDYPPNPADLTAAHKAFTSGYQAARHQLGQETSDE
ncbi:MAG: hypothetical protein ACI39C_07335 [Dietzia sp.]